MSAAVSPGRSFPLGAVLADGGVNFSVFSRGSTAVQLVLFDHVDDERPSRIIELESAAEHTWDYWHAFVPGIGAGQLYGYRAQGPFAPAKGLRFDPHKLLLDPYARCLARPTARSRQAASRPGDNMATAYRGVVIDPDAYDWGSDRAPRTPYERTIIYEMHVGNFTGSPSSRVAPARRGSFAAIIDKIPYLSDLGVTAVELLPVFAFDEQAAPPGLRNVWGYEPVCFFAPHPAYSSRRDLLGPLDEFRDMVKALHGAGIEVILDVVYNHTAEGDADGPTLSFRGLANDTYYILRESDGAYADYSGTGNSLNANDAVVRRMILESLRYWVREMHVDGFRFDLASVLSRDEHGVPIASPPVISDIESDPVLADAKLIAEAWDVGGLYQLGNFGGKGWHEWNGRFRDDVRGFVKSDDGTVRALACRLSGSPDIYRTQRCDPPRGINFVTSHDGFTLNDLVSYDRKHNEANLESNRDGTDYNLSWNCGAEGPTSDAEVNRRRDRQVRNLLTLTLLATGTPMLLMGDELRRSQRGNNNAYCIDDASTWLDWGALVEHAALHRFARELIALRRQCRPTTAFTAAREPLTPQRIEWHGVRLQDPDWGDESHSLAATFHYGTEELMLHLMINAFWQPLTFEVPPPPPGRLPWQRAIDTARSSPDDIHLGADAETIREDRLAVEPRSLVVLLSRLPQAHQG